MSVTLTSHLTSLSTSRPYSAATQHPFLTAAGNGTLSHDLLSLYLSQDRIYAAHGYPRFIGLLLASIPFSSRHGVESRDEQLNQRIVRIANYALTNVIREVTFFVETAQDHGLDLDAWKERKQTRDYTAEMIRVASAGRLEDAVVFLWAMERVRLHSAAELIAHTHAAALIGIPGCVEIRGIREIVHREHPSYPDEHSAGGLHR